MKKDKYVYIVNGSEDGILGVFTTRRIAIETAVSYVKQAGGGEGLYFSWATKMIIKTAVTINRAITALGISNYLTVESNTTLITANIEKQDLINESLNYQDID